MDIVIKEIKQKVTPILVEYDVEYAGIFGSVARGEATSQSDVDILVRLHQGTGMFEYMRLINNLENALQKKVDLVTESGLNKFVRPYALRDLKTIYEKR